MLRLLIVDDQPLIRRGLAMMLAAETGVEVVGQAVDGRDAVAQALATKPDVVVMDLQMPHMSGVVATREITSQLPDTRVVVLSTYDDDELVFEALRAGAQAYLLKDSSEVEVLDTIRSVHGGESRLSPAIARKVLEQFRSFSSRPRAQPIASGESARPLQDLTKLSADIAGTLNTEVGKRSEQLTQKESRILDLLAQGKSNKQIAAATFLAEGTIKNYVSRIMAKLQAESRTELAVRAAGRR